MREVSNTRRLKLQAQGSLAFGSRFNRIVRPAALGQRHDTWSSEDVNGKVFMLPRAHGRVEASAWKWLPYCFSFSSRETV